MKLTYVGVVVTFLSMLTGRRRQANTQERHGGVTQPDMDREIYDRPTCTEGSIAIAMI